METNNIHHRMLHKRFVSSCNACLERWYARRSIQQPRNKRTFYLKTKAPLIVRVTIKKGIVEGDTFTIGDERWELRKVKG